MTMKMCLNYVVIVNESSGDRPHVLHDDHDVPKDGSSPDKKSSVLSRSHRLSG